MRSRGVLGASVALSVASMVLTGAALVVVVPVMMLLGEASHAVAPPSAASVMVGLTPTTDTATPDPTPTSKPPRPQESGGSGGEQDGTDEWLIALASALGGALLTLLGDRIWEWRQDRKSLAALLDYLNTEVERNRDEAMKRSERLPTGSFAFDPALGAAAWEVVRTSAVSWRLARRRQLFSDLVAFYDAVESANHQAQVASQVFTITQIGDLDGEVAQAYHAKAMSLTINPYSAVVDASGPALRSLKSNAGG